MKTIPFDESKIVQEMGLKYYQIPVPHDQEFSAATFAEVEETYMSHHKKGEKVLVHSSDVGRAAAWFAYHLKMTHGDSVDAAMEQTDALGLDSHSADREKTRRLLRD